MPGGAPTLMPGQQGRPTVFTSCHRLCLHHPRSTTIQGWVRWNTHPRTLQTILRQHYLTRPSFCRKLRDGHPSTWTWRESRPSTVYLQKRYLGLNMCQQMGILVCMSLISIVASLLMMWYPELEEQCAMFCEPTQRELEQDRWEFPKAQNSMFLSEVFRSLWEIKITSAPWKANVCKQTLTDLVRQVIFATEFRDKL